MDKASRIKILMPAIWTIFSAYLNFPDRRIDENDILNKIFGKGDKDVKEVIDRLNKVSEENNCGIHIKFKKNLTYKQLLLQL